MDREQIAKQQQLIEEYFFLAYFYILASRGKNAGGGRERGRSLYNSSCFTKYRNFYFYNVGSFVEISFVDFVESQSKMCVFTSEQNR